MKEWKEKCSVARFLDKGENKYIEANMTRDVI